MTIVRDRWVAATNQGITVYSPGEMAHRIVEELLERMIPSDTL
jgi:hypothetical protein